MILQSTRLFFGVCRTNRPERCPDEERYFDISGVAGLGNWEEHADLAAKRMRQLGPGRLLYGSDAAVPGNLPTDTYKKWRQTPLTEDEFRIVEGNVAPYLRKWLQGLNARSK